MKSILLKLGRWLMQLAAGFVILLALLVGVARLALPEADAFSEDLKAAVLQAVGMELNFTMLSAGASTKGPELNIRGLKLAWPDGEQIAQAREITVALNVWASIKQRKIIPGYLHVEKASLSAALNDEGALMLQGRHWREYLKEDVSGDVPTIDNIVVSLADISFDYRDLRRDVQPIRVLIVDANIELTGDEMEVEAQLEPLRGLGRNIELKARVPLGLLLRKEAIPEEMDWDLRVQADDFHLAPWLTLVDATNLPLLDSKGSANVAVKISGQSPVSVIGSVALTELEIAQPGSSPLQYDSLAGELNWQAIEKGWRVDVANLQLARGAKAWPRDNLSIEYQEPSPGAQSVLAEAGFLRLEDIQPVLVAIAGAKLAELGVTGSVAGDIRGLNAQLNLQDSVIDYFNVAAQIENVAYLANEPNIDVRGFSGKFKASQEGGQLDMDTADAYLGVPAILAEPIEVTSMEGVAVWRAGARGYRLIANDLNVVTADAKGSVSLEFFTDTEFAQPEINLTATASMDDLRNAVNYLPVIIPADVRKWVESAVVGGRSREAQISLRGPLKEFPFRDDQGEFLIRLNYENAGLDYAPGWPVIEQATGVLVFENESLYSTENSSEIAGVAVENANARIADLAKGLLEIRDEGPVKLDKLLQLLQVAPVSKNLGKVFQSVRASGDGQGKLRLTIPLKDIKSWKLSGGLVTSNGSTWLDGIEPRFTNMRGRIAVDQLYVSGENLTATLLGQPVAIRLETNKAADAAYSHRAVVTGSFPYERIENALALPKLGVVAGKAPMQAEAFFPAFREGARPFYIDVSSQLEGMAIKLPYPLSKAAEDSEQLDMSVEFPADNIITVASELERGVVGILELNKADGPWKITRGAFELGNGKVSLPELSGVEVRGYADNLVFDDWLKAFDNAEAESSVSSGGLVSRERWQDYFSSVSVRVGELFASGYRFPDVDVDALFRDDEWDVTLAGPWTEGRMTVPYELTGSVPMEFELDRLLLIESTTANKTASGEPAESADPRDLPGMRGTVKEFALGNFRLGRLELDVKRTARGLKTQTLRTVAPSFSVEASGDWAVIDNAQRSRVHVELNSTDVEDTLKRLAYAPMISARSGAVTADLLWEGGPGMESVYQSTGKVRISIDDGKVDINPGGGGRIMGLLSVTSLPRRLALDFRDVFSERLEFENLSGDFRLDFGTAWTCNLGMKSAVADMAVVGRTGLTAEDYDQVAVVRPNVSNILPVPAAWLAGPAAGIATLLVTQIFKKPLKGLGESYYTIKGDWETPEMLRVQRNSLDTRPFADCEDSLPRLSPEEILAIEEMAASSIETPTLVPAPAVNAVPGPDSNNE